MAAAWEYLVASWSLSTNLASKASDAGQSWEGEYLVLAPGATEPQRHPAPISDPGHALINELGSDGWELVNESVTESMIGDRPGVDGNRKLPHRLPVGVQAPLLSARRPPRTGRSRALPTP